MKAVEFASLEAASSFADECETILGTPPVDFIGGGRHSNILPRYASVVKHPIQARWLVVVPDDKAVAVGAVDLPGDWFTAAPAFPSP